MLAPEGVALHLSPGLVFGAVLASIMPISLFFATHTTVRLVVAPVRGSVAARQRRAAKKLSLTQGGPNDLDRVGTARTAAVGTPLGTRSGTVNGTVGPPKKSRAKADPKAVLELHGQNLSQRDIADRLGVSKTQVNRIVSDPEKYLALSCSYSAIPSSTTPP